MPSINSLELGIKGERCRVNKTVGGKKELGTWIDLPVSDQDLVLSSTSSALAIVVNALEKLGGVDIRDQLKNPKWSDPCDG